jgi:hypothetical protein
MLRASTLKEHPMTVTLTQSYKNFVSADTAEFIEGLLEDNYELTDILEFIDEHNEEAFVEHYVDYVEAGEANGYNVVDAFVSEFGIEDVRFVEEAFVGGYRSEADFAEEFYNEQYNIPCELVVDWQQTWDSNLYYDFTFVAGDGYQDGYVFRSHY